MTSTKKLIIVGIAVALVLIFLNNCKSPSSQPDAVVSTPTADSADTTAQVDTAKAVGRVAADTTKTRAPLKLVITNLKSATGPVIIGVYNETSKFPDPKGQLKVYTFTPDSISLTAFISDLPFGIYALAIYQDVNSNGKIDKNFIGVPTEPYAFSNNYKPTVKAPAFKNCRFNYCADTNVVAMKMIR